MGRRFFSGRRGLHGKLRLGSRLQARRGGSGDRDVGGRFSSRRFAEKMPAGEADKSNDAG
jgi:hypothetical protein